MHCLISQSCQSEVPNSRLDDGLNRPAGELAPRLPGTRESVLDRLNLAASPAVGEVRAPRATPLLKGERLWDSTTSRSASKPKRAWHDRHGPRAQGEREVLAAPARQRDHRTRLHPGWENAGQNLPATAARSRGSARSTILE